MINFIVHFCTKFLNRSLIVNGIFKWYELYLIIICKDGKRRKALFSSVYYDDISEVYQFKLFLIFICENVIFYGILHWFFFVCLFKCSVSWKFIKMLINKSNWKCCFNFSIMDCYLVFLLTYLLFNNHHGAILKEILFPAEQC